MGDGERSEIKQGGLVIADREEELGPGPKRAILESGAKFSLKISLGDNKYRFVGYEVPQGKKIELFSSGKAKNKDYLPRTMTEERSRGEEESNKEDQKIWGTLIKIYGTNERGEYTDSLTELKFKRENFRTVTIKRGNRIWCDLDDFRKRLIKPIGDEEEKKSEMIEPEKETEEDVKERERREKQADWMRRTGNYFHGPDDENNDDED